MDFRASVIFVVVMILSIVELVLASLILNDLPADLISVRNLLIALIVFDLVHIGVLGYILFVMYKGGDKLLMNKIMVLLSIAKTSLVAVVFDLLSPLQTSNPSIYWNGVYLLGAVVVETTSSVIFV